MKTVLPILALLLAIHPGRAAQPSIATVNFKTVFKGYWRTQLADKKILAKQKELEKALEKHIESQNALGQDRPDAD